MGNDEIREPGPEDPKHRCMWRTKAGYCRRNYNHPGEHSIRPSWDEYFMGIARAVSLRGDCTRRRVGCVLVSADHRIIGTGYNGAEPGGPSCLAGECPRGRLTHDEVPAGTGGYHNCIAIHAEANALLFARESARGATAYVTSKVCPDCAKLLRGAGVVRVVELGS